MNEPQAVVVTGVYGVGKTSVVEEMAEQLENTGLTFGAIDLDWLWWFNVPSLDDHAVDGIGLANLAAVASNYLGAGVSHLMLAGAIEDNTDLAELGRAIRCPLRVVRLTLPYREIENRLARGYHHRSPNRPPPDEGLDPGRLRLGNRRPRDRQRSTGPSRG